MEAAIAILVAFDTLAILLLLYIVDTYRNTVHEIMDNLMELGGKHNGLWDIVVEHHLALRDAGIKVREIKIKENDD